MTQSKFLAFHNYLMDLGKSVPDMKDEIKGHLTRAGWQAIGDVRDEAGNTCTVDFVPPASEAFGNAVGRDVVRLIFGATSIRLHNAFQTYTQRPRIIELDVITQGYSYQTDIAPKVKLGATEFTGVFTPLSNYTDAILFRDSLYNQMLAAPAALGGWTISKVPNSRIRLTEATFGAGAVISGLFGVALRDQINDSAPGTVTAAPQAYTDLPVDLAGGWVYFLSILSRTFELASLTNTATTGPVLASYTDHATALSGMPDGCMPIELLTGTLGNDLPTGGNIGRPSLHYYSALKFGHAYAFAKGPGSGVEYNYDTQLHSVLTPKQETPITSHQPVNIFLNNPSNPQDSRDNMNATSCLIGPSMVRFFTDINMGSVTTPALFGTSETSQKNYAPFVPSYSYPDVLANLSSVQNFTLVLAVRESDARALDAALAVDDVALTLVDGSDLPSAGAVTIGTEVIEYTVKNGNTLSGLTRGRYGTVAALAPAGAFVLPGDWVMRFNGTMMPCGPTKPNGPS